MEERENPGTGTTLRLRRKGTTPEVGTTMRLGRRTLRWKEAVRSDIFGIRVFQEVRDPQGLGSQPPGAMG